VPTLAFVPSCSKSRCTSTIARTLRLTSQLAAIAAGSAFVAASSERTLL
jgi:hypothetical protein